MSRTLTLVVLISGRGSNLTAILEAIAAGTLDARIARVISNRPDAPGLAKAAAHGVATTVIDHTGYPDRASFDAELRGVIDAEQPDWLVCAGFMRIFTDGFVEHYSGRMINIHPSLLPAYKGTHTHERALAAGDHWHGASVHLVTPTLDDGPVLLQARVPVYAQDSAESLAARVLVREHRLYPMALGLIAAGRLCVDASGHPRFDGAALTTPLDLDSLEDSP